MDPPATPTVRHAGRAHVRGKIRRIWRPRYLELLDHGIVQYYEVPEPATLVSLSDSWHSTNNQNNDASLMVHKYTLQISHARILDVTTLRDMHVGLPRGTFGFTFRGERLLMQPPSSSSDQQQEQQPQQALESSALTDHSHSQNATTTLQEESRDFLCAVTTLEEAQMWVVALQWAASERWVVESLSELRQSNPHADSIASIETHTTSMDYVNVSKTPTAATTSNSPKAANTTSSPRSAAVGQSPPPATASTTTNPPLEKNITTSKSPRAGKIVVTKVTTIRAVRIETFQWEWAYEIQGLFLTTTNNNTSTANAMSAIQIWTALRTARDLWNLVQTLAREWPTSEALQRVMESLLQLPRLSASSLSSSTSRSAKKSTPTKTIQNASQSVAIVDGIVRSLVSDATLVRAAAMKEFLGMRSQTPLVPLPRRWWSTHQSHSLVERRQERLPNNMTPDVYVQQWLEAKRRQSKQSLPWWDTEAVLWFHSQPAWVWGGVGVSSVAVLARFAWAHTAWIPSLTLRADQWVMSWMGAAYLGYRYGQRQQQAASSSSAARRSHALQSSSTKTVRSQNKAKKNSSSTGAVPDDPNETGVEILPASDTDDEASSSSEGEAFIQESSTEDGILSSPLPQYPQNDGRSCWRQPPHNIFHVRSVTYLKDRVKEPSGPNPLQCRGIDVWINDNPERHIARHPAVLGGKLGDEDTFLVNFLLPFGNFVAYFSIPPLNQFPRKLRSVWTKFLKGDQQYRDARLKLLPVVAEGPWIVKAAVGPGKSPALLGKVIPLQYFFRDPDKKRKGVYEVDVIITASSIAKGILSVVKGNTKTVSIAFAFIIEAAEQEELPETVLCSTQVDFLDLEKCPQLPPCNLDELEDA